jgi:hypothetical protein
MSTHVCGMGFLGLIGLLFTISRTMLKKQPLIYMHTIIIIIYGKRNPQPFEGSIFLIKIPIQGCYVALIERKEKLFPCV